MATSTFRIVKIKGEKRLQIAYITAQKKYVQCSVDDKQLSLALLAKKQESIDSLRDVEVEFEEENGQPVRVREKGKEWEHPEPVVEEIIEREIDDRTEGDFHNPYNFVPALPRDNDKVKNSELGDRNPLKVGMGHGVYQSDRWSGRIAVILKTKTPLLIPDIFDHEVQAGEEKGHKTYPLRLGKDGKPSLPPTSIKGMLRSAYEAITNSRLGVFEKHSDRLTYRMEAKMVVVPAIVVKKGDKLLLRILDRFGKLKRYKSSRHLSREKPPLDKGESLVATKYDGTDNIPKHGAHVLVKLDRKGIVSNIIPYAKELARDDWKEGFVCITGASIESKTYERVFILGNDDLRIPVTDEISLMWTNLISNYQDTHERDLEKRSKSETNPQDYLGHEPGKTAWSRHVYLENVKALKVGTLCYVELVKEAQEFSLKSIVPVMISRRLYDLSPKKLLSSTLRPAINLDELSTADRVFGWVNQDENGKGAYKGNLRIHSVKCGSDNSIHKFDDGLALAILGQPKPQQARFYVAQDDKGTRLKDGVEKQTGYSKEMKSLRGRKVYPHHQLPLDIQEYSQNERSDQNRSIRAWVKPNVEFTFDIDVTNLSDVELGGLLWLLSLPENHYHRLGGGKPFGFGSVSLTIDWGKTDVRKGDRWREFYSDLSLIANPNSEQPKEAIAIYQSQVEAVYGSDNFEKARFIKAFCQAAQGFGDDKPIHYPRRRRLRDPENKIFEWFVENESTRGQKLSLPDLTSEQGLPYYP